MLNSLIGSVKVAQLCVRKGYVTEISGLVVYATGPDTFIGELCQIFPKNSRHVYATEPILAEVIGIRKGLVTLMPFGPLNQIAIGSEVIANGLNEEIPVDESLIGKVIDGFGNELDQIPFDKPKHKQKLKASPINPLQRPRITEILETGVRVIDTLLTIGRGQRVGIFAGSGVGKSTLLGMITKHVNVDLNVIALIGERGREVKEFIEKNLGDEGMQRSIVVVATSDQPALCRLRAAYAALAIAEYFRNQGKHVLLTMDSITRFAMAKREIGLAAGEPPTTRGYTPSVFAELPELCERCGTAPGGGSITALLTVLVEGDDLNEPISDSLRSILDGHIVLSRHIAHRGQYPALDVLKSASRLMTDLSSPEELMLARKTIQLISELEKNRQMVELGVYQSGSNHLLDKALLIQDKLMEFIGQDECGENRAVAIQQLKAIIGGVI